MARNRHRTGMTNVVLHRTVWTAKRKTPVISWGFLDSLESYLLRERKTGFEPATFSLARRCSTTEPLPHGTVRSPDSKF